MISKKEFLDFINSCDEKAIELKNEDTLYSIGMKHKTVELASRNWTELNEQLNCPFKDGETYRCWVKARAKQKGELEENPLVLKVNEAPKDLTSDEIEAKYDAKIKELYKQQIKTRDALREYRGDLRSEARFEVLCDKLITEMKNLKPIEFTKTVSYNPEEESEAILAISDIHFGCVVNNFYNQYNTTIAIERMNRLADEAIKYCTKFNIYKLNIINLADSIEGSIHTTARITNELQTCEQIIGVSELLSQVIGKIAKNVPCVVYRSCIGNHDRAIQNYKESLTVDNFSSIIDWGLQMRLELSSIRNVDFCFDNLAESFGFFELENGKKVGFSHGDTIGVDNAYQSFCGATKGHIDYIFLSHFHCAKLKEFNGAKVYVNGSVKGTDTYAMTKNLFSRPSQTLVIFDGNNDLDLRINLD